MAAKEHAARHRAAFKGNYITFDQLDGEHPWMDAVPEGYVPYRVRELRTGEIAYFNFPLAKEMGLIPANHPHEINNELKAKLLSTFSIQIINEYDELNNRRFEPSTIKPKKYMASRYLQLQHSSRSGKTSGDGRGIWNGTFENRGKTWDVSSRGTGVTCLSPGSVQAGQPLKTGGTQFGYGCGLAEIDELYGAAIMAEIMHLQGFQTERVLCVIDLGKGHGIGVRAALNLLRPAHIFLYLKQARHTEAKASVDYLIDRQVKNRRWKISGKGSSRYDEFAREAAKSFAEFAARLEVTYTFAWMDWDGDNVLADAGIIDYGSIRQFGIRHDRYRYDDVERFSTTLSEQKHKARLIVQVYAQLVDFIKTGEKKSLRHFAKDPLLAYYDQCFDKERADRILYRAGFNRYERQRILAKRGLFAKFDRSFSFFEKAKVSGSLKKVADGVNHPALFDLRPIFRELPKYFHKNGFKSWMSPETFYRMILSDFAKNSDTKMKSQYFKAIFEFQEAYKRLVSAAKPSKGPHQKLLSKLSENARTPNRPDRITGNALINIVDEIVRCQKKGMDYKEIQRTIDQIIAGHLGFPEVEIGSHYGTPKRPASAEILARISDVVQTHRHDI